MNELESLMERLPKDASLQQEFCEKFLSSPIYVINAEEGGPAGERVLEQDTTIKLVRGEFEDGVTYLPVFTSTEEMARFIPEDMPYLAIDGMSLLKMVGADNVFINPANDKSIFWAPEVVENILAHFLGAEYTVKEDTQVLLGLPSENPVALKEAVSEVFKNDKNVRAAYLALMMKGEERSLVIGAVFDDARFVKNVFDKAGAVGGSKLPAGHFLDFVVIDAPPEEGLQEFLVNNGDKFYVASGNN